MPNYTQNLGLEKPLENENYNINVFNSNVDKIDVAIKEVSNKVDNVEVPVSSVNGKMGIVTLSATDIKATDGKTLEEFKTTTNEQLTEKANEIDATRITTNKTVTGAINELFTNASNGKTLVANAITTKGVSASNNDTFSLLAEKIGTISTGKKFAESSSVIVIPSTLTQRNLGFKPSIILINTWDVKSDGDTFNGSNVTYIYLDVFGIYANIRKYPDGASNSTTSVTLYADGFSISNISISHSNTTKARWIAIE